MAFPHANRTLRLLALALLGGAAPTVDAAQIVVNDAGPGALGNDGKCTLREAMTAANTDTASGATAGECAAGSGADTIVLQAATQLYTLTVIDNGSGQSANGLPRVVTNITVEGNGATVQRSSASGTPDFRLFEVTSAGTLTLRNLALRNGRGGNGGALYNGSGAVELEGVAVSASVASCDGGGIMSLGGTLLVEASEVHDNTAGCSGGGVFARQGIVSILDTEVRANASSAGGGGGIMLFDTPIAFVIETTVDSNTAVLDGGGILTHGAATNVQIVDSVVTNNRCEPRPGDLVGGNGGGIANGRTNNQGAVTPLVAGGIMRIVNTTVSNNVGARNAEMSAAPFGGGVANVGQLTIENSRILSNTAVDGRAGGVWTIDIVGFPSGLTVRDSVVEGNSAGTFGGGGGFMTVGTATIERTLIRANSASNGGGVFVRPHPDPSVTGAVRIVASTLTANASPLGSALFVSSSMPSETLVISSTISANTSTSTGSAISASSPLELDGVTLVDNRGGRGGILNNGTVVGVFNTIIAGNRNNADEFADCANGNVGPVWEGGYVVFGLGTGCPALAGPGVRTIASDQLFANVLKPLATVSNLPSHVPFAGSLVLDAGDPVPASAQYPTGCPAFDQHGRARPQDDDGDGVVACDIGAVEGPSEIFRDGFEDPD